MTLQDSDVTQPLDIDSSLGLVINCEQLLVNFHRSRENPESARNTTGDQQHVNPNITDGNLDYYLPLYKAALEGNWEAAKRFLDNDPSAAIASITLLSFTALHVAASEGHTEFLEKLVGLMSTEAMAAGDMEGQTALHIAAISGSLGAAVALVKRNPRLTGVVDHKGYTPLVLAARYASGSELVWYLTLTTTDEEPGRPFTGPLAADLVHMLISSGYLDTLLYLLQHYPNLATMEEISPLSDLVLTSFNFLSGSKLGFWERFIYSFIPIRKNIGPPHSLRSIVENSPEYSKRHNSCSMLLWMLLYKIFRRITPSFIKRLQDAKLKHHCAVELFRQICTMIRETRGSDLTDYFLSKGEILYEVTSRGMVDILAMILQFCPDLAYVRIENQTLMHITIQHRQEKIFRFLLEKNLQRLDYGPQTRSGAVDILCLAAKLLPFPQLSRISGAALQMQRDIWWFKTVEKLVDPYSFMLKSEEKKIPQELFMKEHKELAEAAETWMKNTSSSCMIVSTLVATVMFAAAFTVPGGNNDAGTPIFLWNSALLVFAISDALALFSSLTSLLMFLSILTARYATEDFLKSLPKSLIIGLASLFFATTTMMVALGATLSIVLEEKMNWIYVPTILIASLPVTIFALLQLPLFINLVQSTFGYFTFRPQTLGDLSWM
ncbi:uncharacterized protein LOC21410003 [Morus notabilis]|uniref:uncharacterized protein LOC21410003 n=1 Tax=Morus notabilis TaxID=981085 RepID=UPI000CECFC1B|nr:uncharacterized protein LOC21410003 [Morus notabilis]